jgi:mycothiol synthase
MSTDDDPDRPHAAGLDVTTTSRLDAGDRQQLAELVSAATRADGVAPLSEHALLHLRADAGSRSHHVLGHEDDRLVSVAHVDLAEAGDLASAELVVRPDRRRHGIATALLRHVELVADAPLHVWAHGDLPAAQGFAAARGYRAARELWQMRRSLREPLPEAVIPEGLTVRAFRPGVDDADWLAVNAAAFAHHPEQGAWGSDDLKQRLDEPWFDAGGFLLLGDEGSGELAGFHWTKVHADEGVGEVYVVGVAPAYQGRGLARPLTIAGLRYLRDRGLPAVILYVDGDNDAAVRTYSGLGFERSSLDVQYARP